MTEIWKQAVGYSNYQVSSLGRVRRITGACGTRAGRILKGKLTKQGYIEVVLLDNKKPHYKRVNRLVCLAFNGPAPADKPFALHFDDVKLHNFPSNLYWGDRLENGSDAKRNGKYIKGVTHHFSKVSIEDVLSIRQMAQSKDKTYKEIGALHSISKSQAHKIAVGKFHGDIK